MVDPRNLIDPCSYRTVTIDEKFLSNSVFSKIQRAENAVSRICDKNLWEKFVNQQKEIESGATGGLDSMKTLSEKVFYEISKNILFHTDVKSPYIQSAMKYIQENYLALPSVEELARIVNLSPFYFMKLFKQELGVSPHAYINQLRINRAKDLMQKGESLLGIAYELGFTDQSHFSKTFLKITGVHLLGSTHHLHQKTIIFGRKEYGCKTYGCGRRYTHKRSAYKDHSRWRTPS